MQNRKVLNYTLLRLLGVGGMAEVWYAENEIGKKAAVKVLLPKFCADEAIVARFQNEAKVMVQLDHPNIRQAYDYTTVDGRPCMVMEYLEGDDLSSRMKRGERFTDEQLQKWWNQIADALNYTHAEGIVHRDLKPSNIFVDKKGNVKLLDFGIAKIKESISMTRTGSMMGTLMYMSPEQVMDTKHIDASTDLYSLAVTFVHLLMGKAPYDTTTTNDYEIRKNIVETPLNMTGIPAEWQNFLRPYLAKNPKDRPALTAFDADSADRGGFVPPVVPEPPAPAAAASDETVVGSASVVATSATDEGTVAEIPSAQPQSQPQTQPRKRRLWPWILAACAVAAVVVCVVLLGGGGSHRDDVSGDRMAETEVPVEVAEAPDIDTTEELTAEYKEETAQPAEAASNVPAGYVDLGLSVYWKASNEWNSSDDHGFYTYDEAKSRFGSKLPTREQWLELVEECKWTRTGSGYRVTGLNGQSITLPASAGFRDCGDGKLLDVGSGLYCSYTDYDSDYVCCMGLHPDWHYTCTGDRCWGVSVRLVQSK